MRKESHVQTTQNEPMKGLYFSEISGRGRFIWAAGGIFLVSGISSFLFGSGGFRFFHLIAGGPVCYLLGGKSLEGGLYAYVILSSTLIFALVASWCLKSAWLLVAIVCWVLIGIGATLLVLASHFVT